MRLSVISWLNPISLQVAYLKIFAYSSGQLVIEPDSILKCIKSQESCGKPCQGDSISRLLNERFGGMLEEAVSPQWSMSRNKIKRARETHVYGCMREMSKPITSAC